MWAYCSEWKALRAMVCGVAIECRGADGEEAFQIATLFFGSRFSKICLHAHRLSPPPPCPPPVLCCIAMHVHLLLCMLSFFVCDQVPPLALPRGVGLDALVPLPALRTACGEGKGMAACPALGLLVTSNYMDNTLFVHAVPSSAFEHAGAGLALVCTLGGASSPAPMQFKFNDGNGASAGWPSRAPPPLASSS
jgi:hypothetical protein